MTVIPDNILDGIKKPLGIDPSDTSFDADIIMHINSAFLAANQLGVGTAEVFSIKDATKTWTDFLGGATDLEAVKSYIYLKVRLLFDPPSSTSLIDAMTFQINELEWRLIAQAEPPEVPAVPDEEDEEGYPWLP